MKVKDVIKITKVQNGFLVELNIDRYTDVSFVFSNMFDVLEWLRDYDSSTV